MPTALPLARRIGCDYQLTVTAAASYTPGDVVRIAPGLVGIVMGTINIASGDSMTLSIKGIWELPMASGGTASLWNAAYWESSSSLVVSVPTATTFYIGRFAKAKTSGQTVAQIELNYGTLAGTDQGEVIQVRKRFTTAEVNAGATILPAVSGVKYRVTDMAMIAYGGNAATTTSVDILGTQSASSVKLMAGLVAGLTQSTLLRAGAATNGVILADGASFVANDVNTAITISKTGSSLATATGIDVLLSYVREAG